MPGPGATASGSRGRSPGGGRRERRPDRRRGAVAALALITVAGLLAACSGDSGDSGGSGDPGGSGGSSVPNGRSSAGSPGPAPTEPRPAPGRGTSSTLGAGSRGARAVEGTLRTADGRERTYRVFAPVAPPTGAGRLPLLVALHGGGGSGEQFRRASRFDSLAASGRAVVVYPDGTPVARRGYTWNARTCCGTASREGVDDVGFVRRLVASLEKRYRIDPARVFAAGHSNGGMFAYRLACEAADVVAAVGVQSGTLEQPGCHPARPVSLIHIHGSADGNVPLAGGLGPDSRRGVPFQPPLAGAATLAAADGCPPEPAVATDPSNRALTVRTWVPCRGGAEVRFVTVDGAGHPWMGSPRRRSRETAGAGVDSSAMIWSFLEAHPRR